MRRRFFIWALAGIFFLMGLGVASKLIAEEYEKRIREAVMKIRRRKALALGIGLIFLVGCAGMIQPVTQNYAESSAAFKELAKISASDWLMCSGIIRGSIPQDAVPSWVYQDLDIVDTWFADGRTLTDSELGFIVGLRIRLAGPVMMAAIKQYAPGILNIAQVAAVLGFIGLGG